MLPVIITLPVLFQFYPLRFEFAAEEPIFFPPGKAANVLRGALGVIFRQIACLPQCRNAKPCRLRRSCPYARIFEPSAIQKTDVDASTTKAANLLVEESDASSPSGLADWPRPFVFRARHLDGRRFSAGQAFYFDLHVFSLDYEALTYFILTFSALAHEGLGPNRGKAKLLRVYRLPAGDLGEQTLFDHSSQMVAADLEPVSLDLAPAVCSAIRVRVRFLSPTELKHEHKIADRPEFPILFGRIRDRISTLKRLYGAGPLDIDYQGSSARAAVVNMTSCQIHHRESERRSSRTGQFHSIGGFVGTAEYEGALGEFVPYLKVATWVGVGRQSVWGKGEIAIETVYSY